MKKTWVPIVSLFGLFLAANVHAQTIAVGVSPASYDLTIEAGRQTELAYTVSRSETGGDFTFDVEIQNGDDFLSLDSTSVTIPDGKNTAIFLVSLDTTDLATGEYNATVNFRENNPRESDDVLSIRYGLQGKVHLIVADADAYDAALLDSGVKLSSLYIEGGNPSAGSKSVFHYEIQNPGNIYIDSVTHSVEIINEQNEVIFERSETSEVGLAPFENAPFSEDIAFNKPGNYAARVTVTHAGEKIGEKSLSFTVSESEKHSIGGTLIAILLVGGSLLIVLGLLLVRKKR